MIILGESFECSDCIISFWIESNNHFESTTRDHLEPTLLDLVGPCWILLDTDTDDKLEWILFHNSQLHLPRTAKSSHGALIAAVN